jgi:hypothetical protein
MSGALRGDIEFEIAVLRTYELYSNYVAHLRGYLVLFIRGDSPRGGTTRATLDQYQVYCARKYSSLENVLPVTDLTQTTREIYPRLPLMERARDAQPSPRLVLARRETPLVKLAPGGP